MTKKDIAKKIQDYYEELKKELSQDYKRTILCSPSLIKKKKITSSKHIDIDLSDIDIKGGNDKIQINHLKNIKYWKEIKMKTKYKYRLAVNEIVWAKVRQLQKTKKFKSVNRTIEYLLNKKGGAK